MRTQPFPLWRTLILAGLMLGAMFGISRAPAASASWFGCRADPVFMLSDGTVLDLSVDIATDVSNVEAIRYVVHGPKGVRLVTALSTPTIGFSGLESVVYYGDAKPNQYITDVLVKTSLKQVATTAYTVFAGDGLTALQLTLSAQYRPIEGYAGQHLIATLYK